MIEDPFKQGTEVSTGARYREGMVLFGGRFLLERRLGRGGMGEVWLAQDNELGDERALKFLPAEVAGDPAAVARLRSEARAGQGLSHPRIVRTYEFHVGDGYAALGMEYVRGRTLNQVLAEAPRGHLEVKEISDWVGDVCSALAYAHGEGGVVHRDLKPSNVIIEAATGRAKVMDFGIARRIRESHQHVTGQEGDGICLCYSSPEQLNGKAPDPVDDLYSLGAMIYELLTGVPPFFRGEVRAQVMKRRPPVMAERRWELLREGEIGAGGEEIPAAWEEMIGRCLAKRRDERPLSAGEVWGELAWLEEIPVRGGDMASLPGWRWEPMRLTIPPEWYGWMIRGAVAAMAAVVAGMVVLPWFGGGDGCLARREFSPASKSTGMASPGPETGVDDAAVADRGAVAEEPGEDPATPPATIPRVVEQGTAKVDQPRASPPPVKEEVMPPVETAPEVAAVELVEPELPRPGETAPAVEPVPELLPERKAAPPAVAERKVPRARAAVEPEQLPVPRALPVPVPPIAPRPQALPLRQLPGWLAEEGVLEPDGGSGIQALAEGEAGYLWTRDGRAVVWINDYRQGDEADWSGTVESGELPYATGPGTVTWRINGAVSCEVSGTMVNGGFDGPASLEDATGVAMSFYQGGRRISDWRRNECVSVPCGGGVIGALQDVEEIFSQIESVVAAVEAQFCR